VRDPILGRALFERSQLVHRTHARPFFTLRPDSLGQIAVHDPPPHTAPLLGVREDGLPDVDVPSQ